MESSRIIPTTQKQIPTTDFEGDFEGAAGGARKASLGIASSPISESSPNSEIWSHRRRASAVSFGLAALAALLGASFGAAGPRDMSSAVVPLPSGQQSAKPPSLASPGGNDARLLPTNVLEKIPPRASGADGGPGDLVNILIVGTESDVALVFRAAGWRAVERTKAGASAAASSQPPQATATLEEEYVATPLGEELLFGKSQDYGFAQDALITVVQARHDVRIWKAPFGVNRQTLWVGTASHEGPWWDDSSETVSYAPDPKVDDERDFVGTSLRATGLVEHSGYVAASGKQENVAAGSDGLHSDGRILVITLIHL